MSDYPNIRSNTVIAQFPYTETLSFRTTAEDGECGQRYAYANRTSYALFRWELTYPFLDATEAAALVAFFVLMQGRRGTFNFTSPRGLDVHSNCRFDMDQIDTQYVDTRHFSTKIIIQEHA